MSKKRKKKKQKKNGRSQRQRVVNSSSAGGKSPKAPISLCMIVKNEEKYLEGCLQSVQDLVSEIIIVDTGSTDKTIEIAQKFGARVIHHTWNDDFAEARNKGLAQATQPWILYLDADERLRSQYHDSVREAVFSNQADAFYIKIFSPVRGVLGDVPHVQAYPRLFRKKPGVKFVGRVHEQITPSLQAIKARFATLNVEIEHLGYALSDEELKQKIKRNLEFLEKQVAEEPGNAYARFQLGQTYLLAGEKDKGLTTLKETLQMGHLTDALAASTMLIIANEYFKDEQYEIAIEWIEKATQKAPRQRLGWFLLSECYAKLQEWEKAIEMLLKLESNLDVAFSDLGIDKIFQHHLISQRLAIYHFNLKNYYQSVDAFQVYFSESQQYRTSLLEKYLIALEQSEELKEQFPFRIRHLIHHIENFDNFEEAVKILGSFCEKLEEYLLQEQIFRKALQKNLQNAMYRFYLGNSLLNQNRLMEAEEQFLEASRLMPDVYEIWYNLGVVAIKKREYTRAIEIFDRIRVRFSDKAEIANRRLAALYIKAGKPQKALELINSVNL